MDRDTKTILLLRYVAMLAIAATAAGGTWCVTENQPVPATVLYSLAVLWASELFTTRKPY